MFWKKPLKCKSEVDQEWLNYMKVSQSMSHNSLENFNHYKVSKFTKALFKLNKNMLAYTATLMNVLMQTMNIYIYSKSINCLGLYSSGWELAWPIRTGFGPQRRQTKTKLEVEYSFTLGKVGISVIESIDKKSEVLGVFYSSQPCLFPRLFIPF